MTITFDLTTDDVRTEPLLRESAPMDLVMTIGAQTRNFARAQEAPPLQHAHIRPTTRDNTDDERITWHDAEWQ